MNERLRRRDDLRLAVVGLGYWGPNVLRSAHDADGVGVVMACDLDRSALDRQLQRYPALAVTTDLGDVLGNDEVNAVVLATPISTHFELARQVLLAGKHVLVEKPLANTPAECAELIDLAAERDLVVMPGHTFLYSPPVVAVKNLLESGELGKVHFITSSRVNLGIHQRDNSVIRDLAPHDFSILLYWLGRPASIRAIGRDAIVPGIVDVAFVDLTYGDGCIAHMDLSWLAPTKLRRTVLVCERKMIVYEDTNPEQVRVFDRGVEMIEPQSFGEFHLSYRSGDVLSPHLPAVEPLKLELENFAESIRDGGTPRSSAALGTEVVRMVEATERSVNDRGSAVSLLHAQSVADAAASR
jgi:predicted dehydrogenase